MQKSATVNGKLALAVACALGTLGADVAVAQGQLEEIVVTATRRTQTDLQTTPVAVTAVSGAQFEGMFAQDIGEIATFVPNFSAATVTGFNAASFAMRGAAETDIIVYFDPKVGVLVDDFVIPHVQTQLLEPFDIESVEVLRGPQGTLFGKNTTSGAVVVRTKRPDLDTQEVEANLQYGSFDDTKLRFAYNQPLSDTLAFRFAGIYQNSDGYYKNGKVDNPIDAFGAGLVDPSVDGSPVSGDGDNLGGKDVLSMRGKLLWEPSERLSLLGQLEIIRDRSEPVPVVNVTPDGAGQLATLLGFPGVTSGDPLDQAGIHNSSIVGLDGNQEVDVLGTYLNLEYSLDNYTIYGVAGFRAQESRLPNEYLGTSYESFFAATRDDDRDTFQLEARIASELDGPVNFVAGVFYQTNDVDFCVRQQLGLTEFFGSAVPGLLDNENPLLLCSRQDATSYAVFGEMNWRLTDKFSLDLGLRFTDEEKDFTAREGLPESLILPNGGEPLDGADFSLASFAVQGASESWQEPTWRITGSYEVDEDTFGYVTVSRGFKSGGYNDQAGSGGFANFPLASYDPEIATSVEFGVRKSFLEDRIRFNATYFSVTYEDFQRSAVVTVPGTAFQETRTFNAAEVDANGLELELTALITDDLTLRANVGTLNAEYDEFLLDLDLDGNLEDFSGREVVRAPDITAGIDLTYMQDLASGASMRYNLNFNYEDENTYYYNEVIGSNFDTVLERRTILNANVTYRTADDRYYISLFGKNLTDDRYKTAAQAVGALWTFANYGPPRVWGVEGGFRFGSD